MIHGLFLDPRAWEIDFKSSPFWVPEKFGVKIDLHKDAFRIPELGIDKKYKFILATEVWEKPIRKVLQYAREKGIKVFLTAREPIKHGDLIDAMFSHEDFNINGKYYFTPDVVFAAGERYADLWKDKTKTDVVGYPRWDWYIGKQEKDRSSIRKKYKIDIDKKIIFFISYPPYHYKKVDGKDSIIDLFKEHDGTLKILEEFALNNKDKYQIISKIHPMAMKCFLKGTAKRNEVSGVLKKYYEKPTNFFKVFGDSRMSGEIQKELLVASDLVVGFNSTMLLEALLIKKPSWNIVIGNCNNFSTPYDRLKNTVHNEKEMIKMLGDFDVGKSIYCKEDESLISDYMYRVDGKFCERICSAIKQEIP